MKKFYCFICLLFLTGGIFAQRLTPQQYIEMYKDLAIAEMYRTGVPASIKLAQGILESESGNGNLVKRSNNHFGIKCKSYWEGERVYHDDDERGECFRKYDDPKDSYRDHSDFLRNSERYATLFKLKKTDYKGWAHGLKKAGYATNPRYAQILIWQIDKYNLHQYDLMPDNSSDIASVEQPVQNAPTIPVVSVSNEVKNDAYDIGAVTKRNGLKAIFATAGTSLLAIATKQNIPLSKLLEYNDMTEDGLLEDDEWIYLERKNKMSSQEFHVAEEGDTYYYIAQSHGVQYNKIIEYNGVKEDDYLSAGQKVWLRPVAGEVAATSTIVHKVQAKEGLYSIARKYNVTVDAIRKLNNLDSDVLHIGQQLIISK